MSLVEHRPPVSVGPVRSRRRIVRRDGAPGPAFMNLKRFTRGPALYILLGLILVLAVDQRLRGNGGYTKSQHRDRAGPHRRR